MSYSCAFELFIGNRGLIQKVTLAWSLRAVYRHARLVLREHPGLGLTGRPRGKKINKGLRTFVRQEQGLLKGTATQAATDTDGEEEVTYKPCQ